MTTTIGLIGAGRIGSQIARLSVAHGFAIVVVTVPLKNYRAVPVAPLAGKIVIDTNNYYPQRDGHIPELDHRDTPGCGPRRTAEELRRDLAAATRYGASAV
jgi:predicted dinucleotide-binding enzyme